MLSLYRSTTLVAPLRAGAARSITSSAVMMAKKKEIGEFISGMDGLSSLVSGGDGVSGVRYGIDACWRWKRDGVYNA